MLHRIISNKVHTKTYITLIYIQKHIYNIVLNTFYQKFVHVQMQIYSNQTNNNKKKNHLTLLEVSPTITTLFHILNTFMNKGCYYPTAINISTRHMKQIFLSMVKIGIGGRPSSLYI